MLTKNELGKFAPLLGFNLGQAEKDYLQHLFLLFLSRHLKNEFVFKGGTALQKIYGLNRFSEDLDFTLAKNTDLDGIVRNVCSDISSFGFRSEMDIIESKTSKNYRLRIRGPLFDGTEKTIATLRIEISLRNDIILEPDLKEIVPIYTDTQPYLITVMNVQEIMAEKIRTILQREKARDVYDLWFLLRKGIKPDFTLVGKKCRFYGLEFSKNIILKRVKETEKLWDRELHGYVALLPSFGIVVKETKEYLF